MLLSTGIGVGIPHQVYRGLSSDIIPLLFSWDIPSTLVIPASGVFTRSGTAYHTQPDGTLVLCAANEARFSGARRVSEGVYSALDSLGNPLTGPFGLLLEPESTNLIFPSNMEIAAGKWVSTNTYTSTLNAGIAPDGTTTATKIIATATSSNKFMYKTFTGAVNTRYCASVYVKKTEYTQALLYLGNTGFASISKIVSVDLDTGVATPSPGTATPDSYGVEVLANGWFRIWVSATTDADGGNYICYFVTRPAGAGPVFTGDGTSGILTWGIMVEPGLTTPSSVIRPTTTVAVVRAVDALNLSACTEYQADNRTRFTYFDGSIADVDDWNGVVPTGKYRKVKIYTP